MVRELWLPSLLSDPGCHLLRWNWSRVSRARGGGARGVRRTQPVEAGVDGRLETCFWGVDGAGESRKHFDKLWSPPFPILWEDGVSSSSSLSFWVVLLHTGFRDHGRVLAAFWASFRSFLLARNTCQVVNQKPFKLFKECNTGRLYL